jgi:hypothetical protein
MEAGVDAIYFAGSLRIVKAMAREGIPVTGHIGYVPRWETWTGVRAVGRLAPAFSVYQTLQISAHPARSVAASDKAAAPIEGRSAQALARQVQATGPDRPRDDDAERCVAQVMAVSGGLN